MTIREIARILDAHGVPYLVEDGRILADTMIAFRPLFEHVEDLTDYTRPQLMSWLGY